MDTEDILVLTGVVIAVLFIVFLIIHFVRFLKRKSKTEIEFYELLLKGIKQGTIEDEEGVCFMFNRLNEKLFDIILSYSVSYERFMDSFQLYVREKDEDGELTKKVTQILKPILDRIKDQNPYANVDDGQRRILLSIEDTMKNSSTITTSERTAIRHNLNDLAIAFVDKQKELLQSKKVNKWTVPISIAGVLATIVFGIIQLFQR